jgi:zinc transport system permease protein
MGAARYLDKEHGWHFLTPLYGAILMALAAAIIIGLVSLYARQREDTVLSAIWSLGMAMGIFFISRTSGYNEDLMSYLFGNILMVSPRDLWLVVGLDAVILTATLLCYNRLLAICFDEEFALLRGVRVGAYYLLLLCLTALTVVLLIQVVGIVMVIALLAFPAAIASILARRLWQMMVLATGVSVLCTSAGLALSYGPDLPAGATIITLAGCLYLLVMFGRFLWRRVAARLAASPTSPSAG